MRLRGGQGGYSRLGTPVFTVCRYNPQTMKNAILLHAIKDEEVKPKPKAPAAGRK